MPDSSATETVERRRIKRLDVGRQLVARLVCIGVNVRVVNFSLGGMLIEAPVHLEPASEHRIHVATPDGSRVAFVRARVVYTHAVPAGSGSFLSGLAFTSDREGSTQEDLHGLMATLVDTVSPSVADGRRDPRVKVLVPAIVTSPAADGNPAIHETGTCLDVSATGMLISLGCPIEPGTVVAVRMETATQTANVSATVMRCEPSLRTARWRIGVRLQGPVGPDRELMNLFVERERQRRVRGL